MSQFTKNASPMNIFDKDTGLDKLIEMIATQSTSTSNRMKDFLKLAEKK